MLMKVKCNTNQLEGMLNDLQAISIGYSGEQIAEGSINLEIVLLLGARDGFRGAVLKAAAQFREMNQAGSSFLHDVLANVMSNAMDLVGKVI